MVAIVLIDALDIWHTPCDGPCGQEEVPIMVEEQMTLDVLRDDQLDGMTGRARPAVSEAEVAPCRCPEMCLRDHENE